MKVIKRAHFRGHSGAVYALTSGRSAGSVISGGADGRLIEWSVAGMKGREIAHAGGPMYTLLSHDGGPVISAGLTSGEIRQFDTESGRLIRSLSLEGRAPYALAESENLFLAGTAGGYLYGWDKESGHLLFSKKTAENSIRSILYLPGRKEWVLGASDAGIYVLSEGNFEIIKQWPAHENSVFALAHWPASHLLVSGSRDARIRFWSIDDDYRALHALPAHQFTVNDIAVNPKEAWLATAGRDKEIRIWSAQDFKLLKVINAEREGGHIHSVNALSFDPRSGLLFSAGDDRQVMAWEIGSA